MEFKFNSLVSTVMLVAVMFAIAADCAIISDETIFDYYQGVPIYKRSRECSMLGGQCVQEGDCAKGELSHKRGLCPDREMGVECCYRVEPRPAPCEQYGGDCMDGCGDGVRNALGVCPGIQKCCILV
ncbi:uncharacterized protein LOC129574395 [Sitodiplosis mosellana]|uniref:uncharacterized protein LOC129574395 n=1 Tax=Sitodiplosis mosellana TaxID=263140 RepID=UPI00244472EF|nr:uncharacterized protein LOC129574395 [Sitodiplosis mosellana]XP_055312356.1 uncharacterized protein LOC129574395 [Sitodiplosis mosellana]